MKHYMPVRLFVGENCIADNAGELEKLGGNCLVVCSRNAARRCGALDDTLNALKSRDIAFSVFDEITPNPAVSLCIRAGDAARKARAEFILGIGGGSAMDAAKAIAVFSANDVLDEEHFYQKRWAECPLPVALVGTTAGTGSEVTMVSVLTDQSGKKHSIHDERLYAAVAFGDPRYLSSMPDALTVSTGIDALSHCIESFFSKKADRMTRANAIEGSKLILPPLCQALDGALDAVGRADLYLGSIYGGLAINITGTCFPHNLGYYLTERFHVPHGTASAAFLKELLALEGEVNPALTEALFEGIHTTGQALFSLVDRAADLTDIKISLTELKDILPRWQDNGSVKNTLGDIGIERIEKILSKFVREA